MVKKCKGDEKMTLTVDEIYRLRDNIGARAAIPKGAVDACLDITSDRRVADTAECLARLSQSEIVKASA